MSTDNFLDYIDSAMEADVNNSQYGQRKKLHKKALGIAKSINFPGAEFDFVDYDPRYEKIYKNGGKLTLCLVLFTPKILKAKGFVTLKKEFQAVLNNRFGNKLESCKIIWPTTPEGDFSDVPGKVTAVKLYIP